MSLKAKPRRCLKCQQMFESQHSGHRICGECANRYWYVRHNLSEKAIQAERGRKFHNGERICDIEE